jgi:hypothetical protein
MSKTTLRLDWCSHEAAKYAVEHWHYSEVMPAGKAVHVGVWENDRFIGCVVFSRGANNTLGNPYGLKQTSVCELTRVALTTHSNATSRIVTIAIRLLKHQSPGVRLIVSVADPEHDHHGGIYQAMGWTYNGLTNSADEYIVQGKRMHGRSMRSKYGTHIGKDFIKKIDGSCKHRYLYPLDDAMRDKVAPLAQPYPKRAASADGGTPGVQPGGSGSSPTAALLDKAEA